MKNNVHILPTDKPTYLYEMEGKLYLSDKFEKGNEFWHNQNIYITSNEEIKEGVEQWYLDKVLNEPYNSGGAQYSSKQDVIVLTDDKKLIADGVQPIPEDFLEWLVNNQTCEEIEVDSFCKYGDDCPSEGAYDKQHLCDVGYKLIIPKQQDEFCHYSGLPSPAAYVEKPNEEELRKMFSNAFNIPQQYHGQEDKPNVIVVGSGLPPAKLTLELTQKEARGLLNCLIRTHANGTDLDVGEAIEEKLLEFLKPREK